MKVLVTEPIRKTVSAVTGVFDAISARPCAANDSSDPSRTTPTARPTAGQRLAIPAKTDASSTPPRCSGRAANRGERPIGGRANVPGRPPGSAGRRRVMLMERLSADDQVMLWPDALWPQEIGAVAVLDGGCLLDRDGQVRIDAGTGVGQIAAASRSAVPATVLHTGASARRSTVDRRAVLRRRPAREGRPRGRARRRGHPAAGRRAAAPAATGPLPAAVADGPAARSPGRPGRPIRQGAPRDRGRHRRHRHHRGPSSMPLPEPPAPRVGATVVGRGRHRPYAELSWTTSASARRARPATR